MKEPWSAATLTMARTPSAPCGARPARNWDWRISRRGSCAATYFESERERELVNAYRTTISSTPTPSDELDGGRFWSRTEIINSIGNGVFTPNFESEYMMLFNSGQNKL